MRISYLLVFAPSVALADPFVTLDRASDGAMGGVEATYVDRKVTNGSGTDAPTEINTEVYGQYVDPTLHVGGYLALPVNYISIPGAPSTTAVADLELGAIYAAHVSSDFGVVLHLGVALPTGSRDNALANLIVEGDARPRDILLAIPGVTARFGASPTYRSGRLFARLDAALDVNLSNRAGNTTDPIVAVAGGGGLLLDDYLALAAEVSVVHTFDGSGNTTEYGAVSVRGFAGPTSPYLAFTVPFDSGDRNEHDFALTVGVAYQYR